MKADVSMKQVWLLRLRLWQLHSLSLSLFSLQRTASFRFVLEIQGFGLVICSLSVIRTSQRCSFLSGEV